AIAATRQRDLAVARALSAGSYAALPTNPELALLLALEAVRMDADAQSEYALRTAVARNPVRTIHHAVPGRTVAAGFAGADLVVAAESGRPTAVWSVADGRRVADLPASAGDQLLPDRSENGWAALQTRESAFTVHRPGSWKEAAVLPGTGPRISRGGTLLAAVAGGELRRWDLPSLRERGPRVRLPEGYGVRDVSADGALVFAAENMEVSAGIVIDARSGRVLATLPERVLRDGAIFTPDGRLVVVAPLDETPFELRDARTGALVRSVEEPPGGIGWTSYVAFTPDGGVLVSGNRGGDLHAWEVATGRLLAHLELHRNQVRRVVFGPDGATMLSVAVDGTACLWDAPALRRDAESMRCLASFGAKGDGVWDVAFSPDPARFLTTHLDGTVRVWDRAAWYPFLTVPAGRAVVSDDGRLVLTAARGGRVQLRDARTGAVRATLKGAPGDVAGLALAPGGALAAVAPAEGPVRVWNGRGEELRALPAASAGTTALGFSPDGARLATGGEDGTVRSWSVRDAGVLDQWKASRGRVTDLLFHPDGKTLVVGTWDEGLRVRDGAGSVRPLDPGMEEGSVLADVALSAGGGLLMIMGDKTPQVRELASPDRVRTLAGHTDEVASGAFSPDGRFLLTGSSYRMASGSSPEDGNEVRLWDAASGREILQYRMARRAISHVAFAGGGTTIVAASDDSAVRAYRCEACLPLPELVRLAESRAGRSLSADEWRRYLPARTLRGWMSSFLPGRRADAAPR
ncbi:MAG TPA: WD40 repeat domain-containing protein, partial [Longimicrobium sp.]|nr:WD40 repeat domain-containing protein [Longimicrobium sp.]